MRIVPSLSGPYLRPVVAWLHLVASLSVASISPASAQGVAATPLENGVPVTGLSDLRGHQLFFTLEVPPETSALRLETSGGRGDVDLYVRFGAPPSRFDYDCRPYRLGNDEGCSFASPTAGTVHVMLDAYRDYAGVTLLGAYFGTEELQSGVPVTDLSGARGTDRFFTIDVGEGTSELRVATSGGSGDADLYVRRGAPPASNLHDCRPYRFGNDEACSFPWPEAGTYHVLVRGFRDYEGVTLLASVDAGPVAGTLANGVPVDGLSARAGEVLSFRLSVPLATRRLAVLGLAGQGSAVVRVRRGAPPTTGFFDCSASFGNKLAACVLRNPVAGDYHVTVTARSDVTGLTLFARLR